MSKLLELRRGDAVERDVVDCGGAFHDGVLLTLGHFRDSLANTLFELG